MTEANEVSEILDMPRVEIRGGHPILVFAQQGCRGATDAEWKFWQLIERQQQEIARKDEALRELQVSTEQLIFGSQGLKPSYLPGQWKRWVKADEAAKQLLSPTDTKEQQA